MKRKDLILALLTVIVWGANFTVIKLGLGGVPSMLLVALRYTLVVFPSIFFIKKPATSWKWMITYGLSVGVGQFACLFYALQLGMPAGLASIIAQIQSFISPFLGRLFLNEKLKTKQLAGFTLAAAGLLLIGRASTAQGLTTIPPAAFLLTIGAPLFWSISNIIAKKASQEASEKGEKLDMLGLVVWSSLIPPLPMLGLSLLIDTPERMIQALSSLSWLSIFSAFYLAYLSTLFAYGIWNYLLSSYPIAKVSPLSLLVPVFGLLVSRLVLFEELTSNQWLGVVVILLGLLVSNLHFDKKVKS